MFASLSDDLKKKLAAETSDFHTGRGAGVLSGGGHGEFDVYSAERGGGGRDQGG